METKPARLLPGKPALWWRNLQRVVYGCIGVFSFVMLLVLLAFEGGLKTDPGWGVALVVTWAVVGITSMIIVESGLSRRRREELRSGYTTLVGEFANVDQLDPASGRVLRRAGEHE